MKHWYHFGLEEKLFEPECVPEGWEPGRSKSYSNKMVNKWADVEYQNKMAKIHNDDWKLAQSIIQKEKCADPSYREMISISTKLGMQDPKIRKKISDGVKRAEASWGDEGWSKKVQHTNETKEKNGTFNTSKPEEEMYKFLCGMYGIDNVIRNYKDERYPFRCDYYIKSTDEFIELNAHFTHGPHPFNKDNPNDLKLLEYIRSKQGLTKSGKKNSYYKYEEVWTVKDVEKLNVAKSNGIRYVMIYKEEAIFI